MLSPMYLYYFPNIDGRYYNDKIKTHVKVLVNY